MLLNGLTFRSLIMNNYISSAVTAMDTAISLAIARNNHKKNLKKRRQINGLKFKKLAHLNR